MSAYLSAVGRSPAPAHPFSSYTASILTSPLEASRRASSSPGPSDLREALAQPSRLAAQEQLLVKQMAPLLAGVRVAGGSSEACRSPVGLGQHRMPFTVPEPRSMSAASRAEPKAPPLTPLSLPESSLQRLPPQPQAQPPQPPPPSGTSSELGGSFAASRHEPPRSAAAMLSSTFVPVDLMMAAQLQHQRQQQQQQQQQAVDLGGVMHHFHPVSRPGVDAVRLAPPPSTAAFSPALPGMMGPPQPTLMTHAVTVQNCVSGRDSPLVSSTSTLGDLQNETSIMNTTKVLEVTYTSLCRFHSFLPNIKSYGDCREALREYYQTVKYCQLVTSSVGTVNLT